MIRQGGNNVMDIENTNTILYRLVEPGRKDRVSDSRAALSIHKRIFKSGIHRNIKSG